MPKSHKITVINKKGIHAYKNVNLTGRAKTFKKGTHVTVKSFEKHNLTTRYKLSNGTYITANKKLVIQGNWNLKANNHAKGVWLLAFLAKK